MIMHPDVHDHFKTILLLHVVTKLVCAL